MLIMDRSRTGRKGPYAGYYVQIAPAGKTFVGELLLFAFFLMPKIKFAWQVAPVQAVNPRSKCFFPASKHVVNQFLVLASHGESRASLSVLGRDDPKYYLACEIVILSPLKCYRHGLQTDRHVFLNFFL